MCNLGDLIQDCFCHLWGIKDKSKASLHSKSSELQSPSLEARAHSRLLSNLSPWSWVGSCVQLRLMKASHLEDRSQNEGPALLLSKGPKWPLLGEEAALSASTPAPFNLPLLCKHLVIQGHPFLWQNSFYRLQEEKKRTNRGNRISDFNAKNYVIVH